MRYTTAALALTLLPLGGFPLVGGCKKGLSEKQIRRIVRDEVQEQLRERKRRQAARPARDDPSEPVRLAPPRRRSVPDSAERESERLRRRIQTLERLVASFSKSPGVDKARVQMMKKQLARMRERLARVEGKPVPDSASVAAPATAGQSTKDWQDGLAAGIRKLGPQRWQVDRRILAAVKDNQAQAAKDASLLPQKIDGKVQGLMLRRIRAKGLFDALGFQDGDVVLKINGKAVTPKNSIDLYTAVLKARLVSVQVRRAGKLRLHVYTLK